MKLPIRILSIIFLLVITATLLFLCSYYFLGLNKYLELGSTLKNLSSEQLDKIDEIVTTKANSSFMSGTLGYKSNKGYFMLWTTVGPKIFKHVEGAVYSTFYFCTNESINSYQFESANTHVPRIVNLDFNQWNNSLRQGDFISVQVDKKDLVFNTIREAQSNDVWGFIPQNLIQTCSNYEK